MRAVWSFWSRPFSGRSWMLQHHEWASFALSCVVASRHYSDTLLVTDSDGARLFAALGVPFGEISTALDALGAVDPRHPNRDKLRAHRVACELGDPYVHVDGDVFLWAPLAPHVERAPVFCESIFSAGGIGHWAREVFERHGGSVPPSWGHGDSSLAGGILGGNDLETLHQWIDEAEAWEDDPRNSEAWQHLLEGHRWCLGMSEEPLVGSVCSARGVAPVGAFPRFGWRKPGVYEHFMGAGAKAAFGPHILQALRDVAPLLFERVTHHREAA